MSRSETLNDEAPQKVGYIWCGIGIRLNMPRQWQSDSKRGERMRTLDDIRFRLLLDVVWFD